MKKAISFVREHWIRMCFTALLLALALWWDVTDLGVVPVFIALLLWNR